MNTNYTTVKALIESFTKEYLPDRVDEILSLLDTLNENNSNKIENAVNLELLASTLIYIYAKKNGINGRGGITTSLLGKFFKIKPASINPKINDLDYYLRKRVVVSGNNDYKIAEDYEYIDKSRYKVQDEYWSILENDSLSIEKREEKLLNLIQKDADFFDPYISLSELYAEQKRAKEHCEILQKGFDRAINLISRNGQMPSMLEWGFIENRHIIRMIYNYANFVWLVNDREKAYAIFKLLLKMNINDNIGARYAMMAILEGFESPYRLEELFMDEEGFGLDAFGLDDWFDRVVQKHKKEIDWWLKAIEE